MKPITNRLKTADEARLRYSQTIEAGVSIDDALDRRMWVNVAKQLQAGTIVEMPTEDNSWYAEALVLSVIRTETGVHIPTFALLSYVDLKQAARSAAPEKDAYSTKFNGADKFVIIRNADKAKIEKGIPTREAAEARVAELMAD